MIKMSDYGVPIEVIKDIANWCSDEVDYGVMNELLYKIEKDNPLTDDELRVIYRITLAPLNYYNKMYESYRFIRSQTRKTLGGEVDG